MLALAIAAAIGLGATWVALTQGTAYGGVDLDPTASFRMFAISNPDNAVKVDAAILDELGAST